MRKIIQLIGLPGSGKTTLAKLVAQRLNAIHINADWARATITSHLGFEQPDRVKQAQALGHMARLTVANQWTVVDFVNPTEETRAAFRSSLTDLDPRRLMTVWMNTINAGRYEDTNKIFVPPSLRTCDTSIDFFMDDESFDKMADHLVAIATAGADSYNIRFNTHHNGGPLKWRIIDSCGEEALASDFDIRGHLSPSMTVEHGIEKYNVMAHGFPRWEGAKFILEF